MSTVLVLGSTGLIGFAVATAFSRQGYQVYGVTRQEDKAKTLLARNEIIPIIGKAQDTTVWLKYAEKADIIIEALSDYQDQTTGPTVAAALIKLMHEHKQKIVIYTSGVWVAGPSNSNIVESQPENPIKIVAWRPAVEKLYRDAGGIVLRPGFVYGRSSALLGSVFFKGLSEGKTTTLPGNGSNCWALVHVDDCADAYVLAVQKAARGEIFNLVSHSERISEIVEAAAKHIGFTGAINYVTGQDPFSEALALHQRFNCVKAKTLLGWNPKKGPVTPDVAVYYDAWKAQ